MNKNIIQLLSASLLLASLAGCGTSTESHQAIEDSPKESTASEKASDITINEQTLLDYNGLTVTAESYEQGGIFGDEIKVLIDNESDTSYGITTDAVIVNNYMVNTLFSETVTPGNKSNADIDLYSSELKSAGIDTIGQIEIYFHLFDPDTYETVYTADPVTIQTSAYDRMDTTPNDDGKELYNENGIRIVGKYVDNDTIWGTGIVLYLENNTERNIIVQCDTLSINGYMMTPYFSCTLYSGKMAVDDITIMQSDLDDNGIESVEDIQLVFRIADADTYETIAESDTIDFSVEE